MSAWRADDNDGIRKMDRCQLAGHVLSMDEDCYVASHRNAV